MMKRLGCVFGLACAVVAASARPAEAQHTLNLTLGYLITPGASRAASDILLIEHADVRFNITDFNGSAIGGEWLIPLGNFLEVGAGASFSKRIVPTVNARVVNSDGSAVLRKLTLRQLPMEATVRFLPLRQSYIVQPYVGGGIAVFDWRFHESGYFVAGNRSIFFGDYQATGNALGPVMVFGLRVARDTIAAGFEARYQRARGSFGPVFANLVAPDIDLGGWVLQFTTGVRVGK